MELITLPCSCWRLLRLRPVRSYTPPVCVRVSATLYWQFHGWGRPCITACCVSRAIL